MNLSTSFALAWQTLRRNGLRSCLTLLGITIGVGAVLTMVAVGNGARASIEDQVVAAGMNVITVTAGNYRMKGEDPGGGVVDHQALLSPSPLRGFGGQGQVGQVGQIRQIGQVGQVRQVGQVGLVSQVGRVNQVGRVGRLVGVGHVGQTGRIIQIDQIERARTGRPVLPALPGQPPEFQLRPAVFHPDRHFTFRMIGHPEDDPMEKHNHPTARDRLGDSAAGLGAAATLTRPDADAIRAEVRGVQYVAAGVHESARIGAGGRRWFTRLHGTESDMANIRRTWSYRYGRFFSSRESDRGEQAVVLGSVVYDKLFDPGTDPANATVTIWNQPFRVTGVISSTSWAGSGAVGDDQFDAIYVPLTTVHRMLNLSKLNTITVTAKSAADTTRVSNDVIALLRKRHNIAEASPDDFVVRTQASAALGRGLNPQVARAIAGNVPGLEEVTLEQLSTTLERSSRTMTALLASVASISLLVGGIGIMNVMLLSVTERTREIGLRMAVGARGRDVLLQFMAEAVTLSLVGGIVGVLVGLAAAGGVRQVLRWATVISPGAIVIAIAVATAVGVTFGLYPARQAARLDPIDALRFE